MADSDKELRIRILTSAETGALQDYNSELNKLSGSVKETTKTMERDTDAAVKSSGSHWELRRALESLSVIFPGLGSEVGLAAEGFRTVADAEWAAAAAADALKDSLLIGIVIAAAQVGTSVWDDYKEKIKAAAQAHAEAMRKMAEETQKATDAYREFEDALEGKDKSGTKKYEQELRDRQRIAEALNQETEAETNAAQERELANATSPEDKEAIQQKYKNILETARVQSKADTAEQEGSILKEAQADLDQRTAQINKYQAERKYATPERMAFLVTQIAELSKQAEPLAEFVDSLKNDLGSQNSVNAINVDALRNVQGTRAQATFETGIRAAMGDYGPKLNAGQQAAIQEVNALFRGLHGNMDAFVNYLKGFKLTNDQKLRDIDNELTALRRQAGAQAVTGYR